MNQKNYNNNIEAFLELVRAGLWEKDARLIPFGKVDYEEVMRLAEEQSVVGLVTAGLEHVTDVKVPQEWLLQFIGSTLQIEEQNKKMNEFVAKLIEKMRHNGVYAILVKGQGIAQCYERPLWRASGDVDLLLSQDNYEKAKEFLLPLATSSETEGEYLKHLNMTIDQWVVELHGSLRTELSSKVDRLVDGAQENVFYGGNVRSWKNGNTQVFLPGIDDDVIFVFTHYLKHFYKGGLGLRQICDWCRLIWTYRDEIDVALLEKRLRKAGLMSEWKAFGAFAVEYLGMTVDAMPLYDKTISWRRKAKRILRFLLSSGNTEDDGGQVYSGNNYLIRKFCSMRKRLGYLANHAVIFPLDSFRFGAGMIFHGLQNTLRGE